MVAVAAVAMLPMVVFAASALAKAVVALMSAWLLGREPVVAVGWWGCDGVTLLTVAKAVVEIALAYSAAAVAVSVVVLGVLPLAVVLAAAFRTATLKPAH